MEIQHNLLSQNACRHFGMITTSRQKSMEKLNSGYRINRSADDAAGLSISEKMRKQIRGLTQASANAQDGISFIQTADGALNEVHSMLQRGNEIAVKAANGTLSDSDRECLQDELRCIKEEIDSIHTRTFFNELRIFPDHGSSLSTPTAGQQALTDKIATEFIPTAMSQIMNKLSGSVGNKLNALDAAKTNPNTYAIDLDVSYIDGPGNTLAYMGSNFYLGSPDRFVTESLVMKCDSADFSSNTLSPSDTQKLQSTIAHELMHGVMDVILPEGMYNDDTNDNSHGNFPDWFIEGTAQLVGGGYTTGWNSSLMLIASSSESAANKLTAVSSYLNNGRFTLGNLQYSSSGNFTVAGRPYGHGYLACAYLCQLAGSSSQTSVSQSTLLSGANKIFNALMQNEANYSSTGNAKSFEQVINDVLSSNGSSLTLAQVINNINNGENNASQFVLALTNASKSTDGSGLYGAGSIIAPSLNSTNVFGSTVTTQQVLFVRNASSSSATASGSNEGDIYLQVGSDPLSSNRIPLKRFSINQAALGISSANVSTQASADSAISAIGAAINSVSTMRSYYGAMQNRLEHTIKNLDNVVENTTAAESRIRDTDMAEEMVEFSKTNILAQAGESMIAQTTQIPQGIISLLQ
ncbi:flagellin [Lachnospiraceae bacterium]|nr:flagellin [Lachnospiraceae bacterium]